MWVQWSGVRYTFDHAVYFLALFVQEKLLGLMSLPTKEKYEELKEKRKEEQEKKLQQERQVRMRRAVGFDLIFGPVSIVNVI